MTPEEARKADIDAMYQQQGIEGVGQALEDMGY